MKTRVLGRKIFTINLSAILVLTTILQLFFVGSVLADGSADAKPISVNNTVTGHLSNASAENWYKITINNSGSLQLKFEVPANSKGEWVVSLNGVQGGNTKELYKNNFGATASSISDYSTSLTDKMRMPEGTYYVCIESYHSGWAGGSKYSNDDYKLTALYVDESNGDYEKEYNDTPRTANAISLNKTITGNLSNENDEDWYYIAIAKEESLQLKFEVPANSKGEWVVSLNGVQDGNTKELYKNNFGATASSISDYSTSLTDKMKMPEGTYYVCIKRYHSGWAGGSKYSNVDYKITVLIGDDETSVLPPHSPSMEEELKEANKAGLIPDTLRDKDLREKINRAEFAAVALQLYNVLSSTNTSETSNCPFVDIRGNQNESSIKKAWKLGITVGTSKTEFSPNVFITREQLATMLCRTLKKYAWSDWTFETDDQYYINIGTVKKFDDDNEISDYAKESVYFMTKWEIIKGVGNNKFAPKGTSTVGEALDYGMATREQAIVMAKRILPVKNVLND